MFVHIRLRWLDYVRDIWFQMTMNDSINEWLATHIRTMWRCPFNVGDALDFGKEEKQSSLFICPD